MELLPGIIADKTALYLKQARTLILSDLHIGYEEEKRSKGVLLPQAQKKYFKKELDRLFKKYKIKAVVLAGDIKHEFGQISREEWYDVQAFIKGIEERGARVLAVGGNHDNLIQPILTKLNIKLEKVKIIQNGKVGVLIVHGDETLAGLQSEAQLSKETMRSVNVVIAGHEHPAARITDGLRTETVKCFLVGKHRYGRRKLDLIIMPSWNPLTFGTDIIGERPIGPLLKRFDEFSAFASVDDQVLAFGKVAGLRKRIS